MLAWLIHRIFQVPAKHPSLLVFSSFTISFFLVQLPIAIRTHEASSDLRCAVPFRISQALGPNPQGPPVALPGRPGPAPSAILLVPPHEPAQLRGAAPVANAASSPPAVHLLFQVFKRPSRSESVLVSRRKRFYHLIQIPAARSSTSNIINPGRCPVLASRAPSGLTHLRVPWSSIST